MAQDGHITQLLRAVDEGANGAMDKLMEAGVTSFKLFMAYPGVLYSDDGEILRAMQKAADIGAMIMMHAENGIAIDVLREQAIERGETDPMYHGLTRPSITEGEATHRAIALAEIVGVPLYIVHMSAKEALHEVTMARDRGLPVYGETCPQYLFLSAEEHLAAPGFEGAKYVCSTPIRPRAEGHQDALWNGLITNDLQVVSTDHCPFCMEDHPTLGTQKQLGVGDFTKIPNGLPGVEDRFQLMYHGGVAQGRFGVNRWIGVCCTAPAGTARACSTYISSRASQRRVCASIAASSSSCARTRPRFVAKRGSSASAGRPMCATVSAQ